jgi:hypothetical protein
MTDKQLSALGERLYFAVLAARLSPPALADLARAILERRPWSELGARSESTLATDSKSAPPHVDESADLAFDDITPALQPAAVTSSSEPVANPETISAADDRASHAGTIIPAAGDIADTAAAGEQPAEEGFEDQGGENAEESEDSSRVVTKSLAGSAA